MVKTHFREVTRGRFSLGAMDRNSRLKLHDLALIQVSRSDCSALALIQVLSLIALALIQSSAYDCSRSDLRAQGMVVSSALRMIALELALIQVLDRLTVYCSRALIRVDPTLSL